MLSRSRRDALVLDMSSVVCITGASGYIASHIVAQCLEKGMTVRATVRDPTAAEKVDHLKLLPGASERLTLFAADCTVAGSFDAAIAGCDAVIHTACPVVFGAGAAGEQKIYEPAMRGTESVLSAIRKQGGSVRTLVMTSSMSAVAPVPEPALKSEAHWSDPDLQKSKDNWYGAAKTCTEQLVLAAMGRGDHAFGRFVAICPTGVFGPMLQPGVNATMGWIASLAKGAKEQAGNDSMSFVDVRDCAAMHVAGVLDAGASGRYMSLVESLHWNEIFVMLKELHPSMPAVKPCDGEPVTPTKFDTTRMDSLGVQVRSVRTILADALADLKAKGALE